MRNFFLRQLEINSPPILRRFFFRLRFCCEGRIAGYVTVATKSKADKKASKVGKLFVSSCLMLVLTFCQLVSQTLLAADKTTLSVLPFSSQKGEQQAWFGKGIADMLMRNLSEVSGLAILERHQLQTFLNEMELGQSAFIKQDQVVRVGKVAKLDQVIYGSYSLQKNTIQINLILVDLNTQEVILRGQEKGDINNIHQLVNRLSLDFIKQRKLPINQRLLANIQFTPTHSIPATEYFYRAMDSYDQGEYSDAFAQFYAASKQDAKYWESFLWMGRMLEFLGMDALAVSAYLSLFKHAPQQTEGFDALLFAAILMEKNNPANAINAYKTLANLLPAIPHSIEAAFRLGKLYEDNNAIESYQAYAQVDQFFIKNEGTVSSKQNRQSRFFRWFDALELSKESIIKMISLYPKLTTLSAETIAKPPRGMIIVSMDNPVYEETRYGETEPIFVELNPYQNWQEKFYAVAAPEGYVITGVDLQIKGHLTQRHSNHDFTLRVSPFPLPRNYHNTWLGVIYGQTTNPTALKKHIPFYGKHQKILTLQFIENHSEINSWKIKLNLIPEGEVTEKTELSDKMLLDKKFYEGQWVGQVLTAEKSFSGIAQPLAKYWYEPRQTLVLVSNNQKGLLMVFVKGKLGSEQTDLMLTHSQDGQSWSTPVKLELNSLSEDFAPKLIRSEDGNIQLFWLSNRRGLGWEIWTSRLETETNVWQHPNRIPLESFAQAASKNINYLASNLLHYAVTQDKRGQWILAYRSYKKREVLFLTSNDTKNWQLVSKQPSVMKFLNPVLIEDKAGVFRLAAVGTDKKLHLWSSNDLKQWRKQSYSLNNRYVESFAMHPMHLFSETTERLLLLISNASYGLQYARFNPDLAEPELDLVKDVGLEAYTVLTLDNKRYLIAQQKNEQIEFRRYEKFQSATPEPTANRSLLYNEYMSDENGNDWRRIYARMRVIQPDVTTVAVESDGRVWWGIESGIMTLKGDDFYSADVTDGFFHHHVTDIVPCGNKIYFTSKGLDKLVLGSATKRKNGYSLTSQNISTESSAITAIHCSQNHSLFLGTQQGKLYLYQDGQSKLIHTFNDESISAILSFDKEKQLWVGTAQGAIYHTTDISNKQLLPGERTGKILALAVDNTGVIWTSINNQGVFRYIDSQWSQYTDSGAELNPFYKAISIIRSDPKQGVWMMPGPQELSLGVIYSDGIKSTLFNSPDNKIIAPTGLAIDADGSAWIGTAFDGLFHLKRTGQ